MEIILNLDRQYVLHAIAHYGKLTIAFFQDHFAINHVLGGNSVLIHKTLTDAFHDNNLTGFIKLNVGIVFYYFGYKINALYRLNLGKQLWCSHKRFSLYRNNFYFRIKGVVQATDQIAKSVKNREHNNNCCSDNGH